MYNFLNKKGERGTRPLSLCSPLPLPIVARQVKMRLSYRFDSFSYNKQKFLNLKALLGLKDQIKMDKHLFLKYVERRNEKNCDQREHDCSRNKFIYSNHPQNKRIRKKKFLSYLILLQSPQIEKQFSSTFDMLAFCRVICSSYIDPLYQTTQNHITFIQKSNSNRKTN